MLAVVVSGCQLGRGDWLDAGLEVEVRPHDAATCLLRILGGHTVGVGRVRQRQRCGGLESNQRPPLEGVDVLVPLEELALGGPDDRAGLATVQDLLTVVALQRPADPSRHPEDDDRDDEHEHPEEDGDVVDRQLQADGHDVVARGEHEHDVERERGHADRSAGRRVARAVEQVVLALVASHPGLDPRVDTRGRVHQRDEGHGAEEDVHAPGETEQLEFEETRQEAQGAVGEAHVPVRLRTGRDGGRVVRTVGPDRVDRHQRRDDRQDAEHHEEEATSLGGVDRHQREADDVLVGAAGAGELGVLVDHDQDDVRGEQADEHGRQQQDVHRVEPRNDRLAGEGAAEEQVGDVGPHQRDRADEAFGGADTGAREQVVRQRVAGEAFDDGQHRQDRADDPVELARLAERAGQEHAQHVHRDGDTEHQGGPVVDLPDQQAATDVERDRQRRVVRLGHDHALQRQVGAVVGDLAGARDEPERQEHAGEQTDDHRVHRHFTEHEAPVIGEDLLHHVCRALGEAGALVDPHACGAGLALGAAAALGVGGAQVCSGARGGSGAHLRRSQ